MRILYIVNDLSYFRAHRERLAMDAVKDGHSIIVASGGVTTENRKNWPPEIKLVELSLNKHSLRPLGDLKLLLSLRKIIGQNQPDVVHCFTIKPILFGGLAIVSRKLKGNLPGLVWTFAGLGKIYDDSGSSVHSVRRWLVEAGLKSVSRMLPLHATFENETDRQTLITRGVVSAERSQTIMGTGVELDVFSGQGRKPPKKAQPLRFLLASRLLKSKGVLTYIDAASQVMAEGANAKFLLAGLVDKNHPDAVDLEDIQQAENAGALEFLENVPQRDMPDLLRATDVFCLPTNYREGLPRSLLEAAACGAALISTDQSGMKDIVVPQKTGWFVKPLDVKDLKRAIDEALADRKQTLKFGTNARLLMEELPASAEKVWEKFKTIYSNFVSTK